ncbi:hypothetical protein [Pedobacter xixiisoli]|uniref:Uncharacterized protein n=1 Tax=Pedobacter xixiisoli TaxID=1476464 RepID=A0A286A7A1_9SPHI|nr:hypothetical protein [Pedobacter xixiisoli]SOD17793.1 hypothetical protein SAMN06297358_2690 [Pedobacter xixiisoli]
METLDNSNLEDNKAPKQNLEIATKKRKARPAKPEKIYKVIVVYSEITEEEARIKRGIIEDIIKGRYLKNP